MLIAHNDVERCLRRLRRDVVPSLEAHPDWEFELVVIDNSERRMEVLERAVTELPWPSQYAWHDGVNLLYGPSMNLAANLAEHPFLLYACMNHGKMVDPTWVDDLIEPFWTDPRIAMTGHRFPSPPAGVVGLRNRRERYHIQGGVLGARTSVIRRYPYEEGRFAHAYSDVWQSYRLMDAGYLLHQVPTVISVWGGAAGPGPWKYIHDHVES
ncbi:MAG TPA: hypothetical protein VGK73_32050 [Polyangiaceae bacterium]